MKNRKALGKLLGAKFLAEPQTSFSVGFDNTGYQTNKL